MANEYYILNYDDSGTDRGVPTFLRGKLNNDLQWEKFDPDPWKFNVTAEYEYTAKHTVVDFDFSIGETLVSERFADLCEQHGMVVRRIPVRMVQSTGRPSEKQYVYMLTSTWIAVLDMGQSAYTIMKKMETGEPVFDRYFPSIPYLESITRAVVDPEKMGAHGIVRAVDVASKYVCTEAFKDACEEKKMLGIRFVPVGEFTHVPSWVGR